MKYCCRTLVLILAAVAVTGGSVFSADTDQTNLDPPREIKIADLMGKEPDGSLGARVVGELGHPLGKLITISGYWRQAEWVPEGLKFHVYSVNGVRVSINQAGMSDIVFDAHSIKPDGMVKGKKPPFEEWDMWELRGYESGAFGGYNSQIFRETNRLMIPHPGYRFRNEFVFFRVEKVKLFLPRHLEVLKDVELAKRKKRKAQRSPEIELSKMLDAAITLRHSAHFRESLAILDWAVEEYPGDAGAYASRGAHHFCRGDHSKATADYKRAIEVDPDCSIAHAGLGGVGLFEGNTEDAITHFSRAIEVDPKDATAFHARGVAHFKSKRSDKALADLNRALRVEPDLWTYCMRAVVLLDLGAEQAALSDLDYAIRFDSTKAGAHWVRSFVYHKIGRLEESKNDRKEAVKLDSRYRKAKDINEGIVILGRYWGWDASDPHPSSASKEDGRKTSTPTT